MLYLLYIYTFPIASSLLFVQLTDLGSKKPLAIGPFRIPKYQDFWDKNLGWFLGFQYKLSHTGGKKFNCTQCDKAFSTSSHLKVHEFSYTGEKQFGCTKCYKAFSTSSDLKRHMFSHTGEKLFDCNQCIKAFSRSSHQTKHKPSHTIEKKFVCIQCESNFLSADDLLTHKIIHCGEISKRNSS